MAKPIANMAVAHLDKCFVVQFMWFLSLPAALTFFRVSSRLMCLYLLKFSADTVQAAGGNGPTHKTDVRYSGIKSLRNLYFLEGRILRGIIAACCVLQARPREYDARNIQCPAIGRALEPWNSLRNKVLAGYRVPCMAF